MEPIKELLTVSDFFIRYSMSRTSFYREVREGRIRLVKCGRRSFIRREDAEAWAANLPVAEVKLKGETI